MRKLSANEKNLVTFTGAGVAGVAMMVVRQLLRNRRARKQAEKISVQKIKLAHALEILEMLDEDLARRLGIAKEALLRCEVEEIFLNAEDEDDR